MLVYSEELDVKLDVYYLPTTLEIESVELLGVDITDALPDEALERLEQLLKDKFKAENELIEEFG